MVEWLLLVWLSSRTCRSAVVKPMHAARQNYQGTSVEHILGAGIAAVSLVAAVKKAYTRPSYINLLQVRRQYTHPFHNGELI